ncbi:hypothetical protein E143388_08158 [Rhodococcus opacus]|nr:hypothetical protein E143388_08158 [Rhodococcus opacus]
MDPRRLPDVRTPVAVGEASAADGTDGARYLATPRPAVGFPSHALTGAHGSGVVGDVKAGHAGSVAAEWGRRRRGNRSGCLSSIITPRWMRCCSRAARTRTSMVCPLRSGRSRAAISARRTRRFPCEDSSPPAWLRPIIRAPGSPMYGWVRADTRGGGGDREPCVPSPGDADSTSEHHAPPRQASALRSRVRVAVTPFSAAPGCCRYWAGAERSRRPRVRGDRGDGGPHRRPRRRGGPE